MNAQTASQSARNEAVAHEAAVSTRAPPGLSRQGEIGCHLGYRERMHSSGSGNMEAMS